MLLNRRQLLKGIVGSVATSFMASPVFSQAETKSKIRAVAFDGFPIFDPRPVFVLAESLFPGKGKALGQAWRIRQFQYQWLRALSGQYVNFWQATEDGLVYAAKQLKLDLTIEKREQLMAGYLNLKTWPDVIPALEQL
ncbi:MAG TPA: haloacid dehalogenase type II, partial [Gammaproteobacteria bacterium]|nr:haloacid dehalogenase type II [Gammaproteobacteria bacterium]